MDLRQLMAKLDSIQEADLTPQQQAQNILQPDTNKDKEKEYARAQQQMDRLEKAAKYSGDDEIVRKRMGLPPKLPSIDQWDGKMPQPTGKPDWVSRLTTGGKATDAQAGAVAANKADDSSTAFKKEKLTQLTTLVSQLKNILNPSNATANTTGGPTMSAENSIFESLLREFEDEIIEADAGSKEQVIAQIKAIMQELGDMGDDPEVVTALNDAQKAIDDASKAPAAAAPGTTGAAQSGEKGSKPTTAQSTTQEKMDRFVYLMKKKKAGATSGAEVAGAQGKAPAAAPATAPTTESMSDLIARIQRIAEGTDVILEALTPEEEQELQAISKEVVATVNSGAEGIPPEVLAAVKDFQAGTTTAGTGADAAKKTAGADPKVQKVQEQLKALGVDPGPIDGKMGPKTIAGIKAFQTMAGIAADGKIGPDTEKALADGKNVVARSQLTQSLTAIEALVTKYKISESVTEEDVLAMTEDEARKFVMKNIKYFSESEQIAIMRDYLAEAPALPAPTTGTSVVPAAAPGGGGRRTIDMGKADVVDVKPKALPAPGAQANPGWGQRAMSFLKGAGKRAKVAGGVIAGALGLGGLVAAFSGGDIEMDPADLGELQKHLKVLDQYGKDPAVKGGLPADVQKRLDTVLAKLDKLRKAKAKGAAPAAGAAPAQTAAGNVSDTPAA